MIWVTYTLNYVKILWLLQQLEHWDDFLNQHYKPLLSEIDLIAMSLAAESLLIDSERYLFKRLPSAFHGKIERSLYNRWRQYQRDLFENRVIRLETPKRQNQLDFEPFNSVLRKARKRIETVFSQLCDQFIIRQNYAKSFQGLVARVLAKITVFTITQWFNQINRNKISNVKTSIA